jgi:hypothetical protein
MQHRFAASYAETSAVRYDLVTQYLINDFNGQVRLRLFLPNITYQAFGVAPIRDENRQLREKHFARRQSVR